MPTSDRVPPPNRLPSPTVDRYATDVLATGWQRRAKQPVPEIVLERGMVLEDIGTGFCGAVRRWENGLVVLEDRGDQPRSFPIGHGFLLEGRPVVVKAPLRAPAGPRVAARGVTGAAGEMVAKDGGRSGRTASGSVAGPAGRAKVALPSRIYVEGRHDAELVEKIWGDDLRHVGVVVEFMEGIDDLLDIVADFRPEHGRRLGVLADHLVPGSKESHIAAGVAKGPYGAYVLVAGHPFVDIWQGVKPARLGLSAWPQVPRGTDIKHGTCAALGWPHRDQADLARAWRRILGRVTSWSDLERDLLTPVEQLIDFVTQDHIC